MKTCSILKIVFLLLISLNSMGLSVATFNIRNFDMNSPYSTDKSALTKILKDVNADIFAFQEIVDTENFKILMKKVFPKHKLVISKCGGFAKQKLALLYNSKKFKFLRVIEDSSFQYSEGCHRGVRPLLKVQLKNISDNSTFWALLVHLKAGGSSRDIEFRKKQISLLSKSISRLQNYIILGDFNTTEIDNSRSDYFFDLVERYHLTDSSKSLKCTNYWSGGISDGLFYPGQLDHVLLSKNLKKKYSSHKYSVYSHCKINQCSISNSHDLGESFKNVSDHCPVKLELTKG
ncbi:hypothetical protein A9Q84_17310 [Halobacteriovorax marinus]|uniref:Endonuclease/exonuclease/phosphatase domain-containing protein n=1 Tax=Halobacteriovorax marinus TaxID=97084 RepID=A0A1Y5F9H1_9BACT|nr:hypothetical protein A9Q84_17310 [Halobacteriovorax marinus]